MDRTPIFFDHSSTTAVDKEVLEAMLPYFTEEYGNPSSHIHSLGQGALKALDKSRTTVASLVNAEPAEIVFTSGATESNNLAVKGLAAANSGRGKHILISQVEHFSVLHSTDRLRKQGFEVEEIPVDEYGVILTDKLESMVREDTMLVCLMVSNTEIGSIQPVKEAVEIVKKKNPNALFHCDAASAAGWIPIDVKDLGVDTLTMSAHNFYGPKGIGALYVKKGTKIEPLFDGGFQERGIRSGTENIPGIVGMAKAAELAKEHMEERVAHLTKLQEKLWKGIADNLDYVHFTGHPRKRLPGHVSFWIEFAEGESILLFLQVKKIMAASGSACSSNLRANDEEDLIHSHVLAAVGVPQDICSGSIAFFMGKDSTEEEVDYVIETLPPIIERLWSMSPAYADMLEETKKS